MAPSSFAPLRHRSFRLALVSSFISSTGAWMQSVAMGVYLQTTTHNPTWLGLVTMAAWLPSLVGAPVGGALADRRHRQRIIQLCNVVMALEATALTVLVVLGRLSPMATVGLALIEGFASSMSWASWKSLLRDLVEDHEVLAAVSLSAAQFNMGRVVGPLVAGAVLAVASPAWCFGINAASFYVMVVAFAAVRSRPRTIEATEHRIWAQIRHGAEVAWRTAGTRSPIISIAVVAFLASPFIAFIPTMAIEIFHRGSTGTSLLVTSQGLGAIGAAIILPPLARRSSRLYMLKVSTAVMTLSLILYGLAPSLGLSVFAMFVLGAAYFGCLVSLDSTTQVLAPLSERSRILALYSMSLSFAYPVGAYLQSFLVRDFGLRQVTVASALLLLVIGLLAAWLRPGFIASMDEPEAGKLNT